MAVSKLWPVTVRLATVLDYASNPEKTTKSKSKYSDADYQALRDVVAYAKDGEKTERELFCEGIHCNPQTAREQFITVKEQFDKPDGIQAYHGYLSFEETDITPELAQQVGMAFAERMWGDRFQVLVTTHLNTEHLHCHFVVNSVSFRDGKRLQNKEKAWWYFRHIADEVCLEHGLSVVQNPEAYQSPRILTQKDKAGMPTRYNLARAALDEAIAMSHNLRQLEYHQFSKTYKFSDINYAVASREDKEAMFLEYSELLNSLDSGATTKITINNRRLNRANFEKTILLPLKGDALDEYREEYNRMLLDKATGANAIIQEKYITISVCKKNVEEARNYFARVGADLIAHFGRLGSKCVELEPDERLRIFHDFYRAGEETEFRFDIKETRRKGHDFKDFICPDSMEFTGDYFKIGERYGRVMFLREYASYIKDSMVAEMTDLNRNLMMSIDVIPVPTDEAVREAESRLLGVETNATNWQRRQNANNNFSAQLPYDIEQQRKEMKEFLDDLTTRDQRMMFAVLTMVHTADTKEQLDNDTEALLTTARKHLCQFGILKFQQLDGLNTAMPFGVRKIESFRTLTTESLAVFIPFRVQDICHTNGVYYGQNVISKNMIIADRRQLLNGNEFILGVSGGGKSFTAKGEVINQVLAGNADIIIIDPEREYSPLVRALGGEIINISATSPTHINAMDMNREYGDGANPVILKSEFIMSLCEQLIGGNNLGAVQKSIIDRCTASVYRTYQQNNYTGEVPTLQDFRAELLKQSEPEAQEIALAIELFTNGSLNTFAKKTNVNTDNRLICYDILDLGKQLMPIGMLVVLDSILNRITQNRAKGKNTFIFIDEIYLLFQHEYSANFLFTLWKRVRKYGAYATGITQNVDDLLQSHTARTMLANSEFIVMLNQASTDRLELAKLLNISDTQLSYITNVDAGHGLIKVGSSLVPFANKFPKNTKLYKLMTTKPGEGV